MLRDRLAEELELTMDAREQRAERLDALKREYPDYLAAIRPAIAVGGLLVADNVLGSRSWWIDEPAGQNADRDAVDRFNRMLAADPDFEAVAFPMREGLLVARRYASSVRSGPPAP